MSLIETRGPHLFPVPDAGQIETAKRFASGPARHFAPAKLCSTWASARSRPGSRSR